MPSENSRRAYQRHLEEFFVWHKDQNRPALNKALINRYVKFLREQKLSSSNINQKLSAIRKLATEAEDNALIDSRIANGIRAVKGVPFRGRRTGNWLTRDEAQMWLECPDVKTLKGVRDRALLAVLIGCGLRRAEAAILSLSHIQQREGRWAIVDIVGKRDKMRTVPMPSWAKLAIDAWIKAARIEEGFLFRRVNRGDNLMGVGLTEQDLLIPAKTKSERDSQRELFEVGWQREPIEEVHSERQSHKTIYSEQLKLNFGEEKQAA